jgi:hypothetical protein
MGVFIASKKRSVDNDSSASSSFFVVVVVKHFKPGVVEVKGVISSQVGFLEKENVVIP